MLVFHDPPVLFLETEVLPEQTDGDPAGPEEVRVLQATRGDD